MFCVASLFKAWLTILTDSLSIGFNDVSFSKCSWGKPFWGLRTKVYKFSMRKSYGIHCGRVSNEHYSIHFVKSHSFYKKSLQNLYEWDIKLSNEQFLNSLSTPCPIQSVLFHLYWVCNSTTMSLSHCWLKAQGALHTTIDRFEYLYVQIPTVQPVTLYQTH